MKSTIAKKTEGYGYKYTELADINKYCEDNKIRYYQEVETSEINQKDYIVTYLIKMYATEKDGKTTIEEKITKHRGCQLVEATLQGIKNPVQEYGSSITYCRRYSLLMALGLATEDDDAASLTQKENKKETKKLEGSQRITLLNRINELELELDIPHEKTLDIYHVKSNNQMTDSQLQDCVNNMEKRLKEVRG